MCVSGAVTLTKDGSGGHRLAIEPEGHLGQDYGHEPRHVRLDDKVANLPRQVEVGHHHCVLTCRSMGGGGRWGMEEREKEKRSERGEEQQTINH